MNNKIEDVLLQNGYLKIPSSLPEFNIFYEIRGRSAIVIQTIDYRNEMNLTQEQYSHIKEQITTLFRQKGMEDIQLFSLFIASDTESVRTLPVIDPMSWIYDTTDHRLFIYEDQVSDFYGLRGLLEQMEDASPVAKQNRIINTPVNTALVLLNIIVFLGLEIFGSTTDLSYMVEKGALFPPYIISQHQYYRLFTCMFLHFGYEHLAYNMLALFFLGEHVELALGKVKYLTLYLLSGLGASSFSLLFALLKGNDIVSAGASGAVFGIIGALFYIVMRNHKNLNEITAPKLLLLIGYSIFSGITGEGIDNAAHIGGLIMGFLLAVLLYKKGDTSYEG